MTKQEMHALEHALADTKGVSVEISAYDADLRPLPLTPLVPGRSNHELMDDPVFRAGYERGWTALAEMVRFVMTAGARDLIRYAGRVQTGSNGGASKAR